MYAYILYLLQEFGRYIPQLKVFSQKSLTYVFLIVNIKNEKVSILLPLVCDKNWGHITPPSCTTPVLGTLSYLSHI